MAIEVALQQPAISKTKKLCFILLANSLIVAVCIIGYRYLPGLLNTDQRGISKLLALLVMAPAIALVVSIRIALKQPGCFRANAEGITLGDAIAGSEFCPWHDISGFSLNPSSKVLKFKVDSLQLKHTFRLKQFGISQHQFEQLQQLAEVGLKSE
ncbi:hypothetical protein [Rheinheimera fenheensis]|uniref:hypothetical protein n=1 Tax=Rheinheimera fenheensis TaxID=3152295 RepID=UPI003261A7DA